ncbi:4-hydroxy-2-oxo-heptane-1,7-dioate aldolase [Rhodobacteraceae bacterium 2CG4]|uniref:Hydroxypyruvate/pyruvate aldolase n=1 Tax=Halovulum marinum TaxID=2662447 RepID=A0A6L5YWS2_9RHOB|nr:HpcH/HpaI aldolase/citrate lyase family protein [Halovulum marinum]MSU88771.1 4-hydroxy-2-oxo-heptane-1,7-dioate aldolase [Halovulum marinum]
MTPNAFKRGLQAGEVQYGLWVSLCSGLAADIVADVGYDWLLVDMEHSPSGIETVLHQMQAIQPHGSTALVRPPWNEPVQVKRLLDAGAPGFLFPMVQTAGEAAAAVAACRYPPAGMRGVSGVHRGNRWGRDAQYLEQVEDETCVLVQVETAAALERAEQIATVEGVDGVFFGPADIAASMGKVGRPADPEVWEAIFAAAARVRARGVPTGTLIGDPGLIARCLDEGFLFVAVGTDHGLLARGAEALLAQHRR